MHQTENGFTKIANSLLTAMAFKQISSNGWRIIFWIIRDSYGYKRKHTRAISHRQIAKEINMDNSSVDLAIKVLLESGVISITKNHEYVFNKGAFSLPSPLGTPPSPLGTSAYPTRHPLPSPLGTTNVIILKKGEKERKKGEGIPPSFVEVKNYCEEIQSVVNPEKFFSFFTGTNWHKGNTLLEDWKQELVIWGETEYKNPSPINNIPCVDFFKKQEEYNQSADSKRLSVQEIKALREKNNV